MDAYKIYFKKSVLKDIEKIPKKDLKRIIKKIDALSEDPRPSGHEKLSDQEKYRIRQGNYRIVYSIQDETHKELYKLRFQVKIVGIE